MSEASEVIVGGDPVKMLIHIIFMDGHEEDYEVWSYMVGQNEMTLQPPEGTIHVPLMNVRTWRQGWAGDKG
jgi:hypothetical protein